MTDDSNAPWHPERGELLAWALGTLGSADRPALVAHLRPPVACPDCAAALAPLIHALLGPSDLGDPTEEDEEDVSSQMIAGARLRSTATIGEIVRCEAVDLLEAIARGEHPGPLDSPLALWAACELLVEAVTATPGAPAAQDFARAAVLVSGSPWLELFPVEPRADLRARAWGELGNALRVAGHLGAASSAMNRAFALRDRGTGAPRLAGRLLDLAGSLERARRRFPEARAVLGRAVTLYLQEGEPHLAGRSLVKLGSTEIAAGEPEAATRVLARGLALLDHEREPAVVALALGNLALAFVELGDLQAANRILWRARPRLEHASPLDRVRVLGIEAKVAQGLGDVRRAERLFREEMRGFEATRHTYDVAIVALDLAGLLLEQDRAPEVLALSARVLFTFRELEIDREAYASLLVLHRALERGEDAAELLARAIAALRRAGPPPAPRSLQRL